VIVRECAKKDCTLRSAPLIEPDGAGPAAILDRRHPGVDSSHREPLCDTIFFRDVHLTKSKTEVVKKAEYSTATSDYLGRGSEAPMRSLSL